MESTDIIARGGFAFRCSPHAQIEQVLRDDSRIASSAGEGQLFTSLVAPESLGNAYRFLAAVCGDGQARGWELALRTSDGPQTFHLAGTRLDGYLLLVGAESAYALDSIEQASLPAAANQASPIDGGRGARPHRLDEPIREPGRLAVLERPLPGRGGGRRSEPRDGDLGTAPSFTSGPSSDDRSVLRAFVDRCTDGMAIVDEGGIVVEWNPALSGLTEVDRSEALGSSLVDLMIRVMDGDAYRPDTRGAIDVSLRQLVGTNQLATGEECIQPVWLRRRDGSRIALELAYFAMPGDRETLMGVVSRDVTKRLQLEEHLRRSEAALQGILDAMSDGVTIVGLDGKIHASNGGALQLFGGPSEEVIGTDVYERIALEDRERARSEAATVLEKGFVRSQVRVIRQDGGTFDAEIDVSPLLDEDGQPKGFVGVTRDISDRKRADVEHERLLAQVQQQAHELDAVVQSSHALLVLLDRGFRVVRANPAAALAVGLAEDQLLGRTIWEILPGSDVQADFERVRDTGVPFEAVEMPYGDPGQPWLGTIYYNFVLAPVSRDERGEVSRLVLSAVDVTSLVRARLSAEAFAARFRASVESLADGFATMAAIHDETGQIVDFQFDYPNEATCRLLGCSRGELMDLTLRQVLPPEISPFVIDKLRTVVETGEAVSDQGHEWQTRSYDYQAARLGDGIVASWRDTTARARSEEALRESERQFRLLFDGSPIGAALVSPEHRFLHVNDALCRITGYSADELTAMRFGDITHPDDWNHNVTLAELLLAGEIEVMQLDKRYNRKDGSIAWVSVSSRVLRDDDGHPVYLVSTMEDITERKRAEEERESLTTQLAKQAAMLEVAIDSMPGWVVILAPDGTIVQANRAVRESGAEPTGGSLTLPTTLFSGLFGARAPDGKQYAAGYLAYARALRGEKVADQVIVMDLPSGGSVTLSLSASPITLPGSDQMGAVAIAIDLSRLYEMEAEREIFVNMISHDLRNVLSPIVVASHMLSSPKMLINESVRAKLGRTVSTSVASMSMMIDELAESVRLSSGQVKLALEPMDLSGLVGDLAEQTENRVVVDIARPAPQVMADPARLERVMTNLISNALKYSNPNENVVVSVRAIKGEVVVSVADRGVGIPSDELPHVFDRSYRASTGSTVEGLGLGLHIARLIVQAHGGRIWARSKVGKGSTFCFALPFAVPIAE